MTCSRFGEKDIHDNVYRAPEARGEGLRCGLWPAWQDTSHPSG